MSDSDRTIEIDAYVLSNVFMRHDYEEEGITRSIWFRETIDNDGWVILFPDGEHFHTYRYPPDWF